jgi:hypothetical protein
MFTLLTSLTATAAGKAAVALTGLTLAGGGAAIATDGFSAEAEDQLEEVIAQLDERDDDDAEALEVFVEDVDTEENGQEDEGDNEGRSEAVHDALTGEDSDLTPEDGREFGQQVAENAQNGGVGGDVSEAARNGNGEEAAAEGQSRAEENRQEGAEASNGQDRADEARAETPAPSADENDEDDDTDTASTGANDRAEAGADNGKGQGGGR